MNTASWSSLSDQLVVAEDLFGATRGRELLGTWLDEQKERVDSPTFGNEFAQHVSLPGMQAIDYCHRYLRTRWGNALGGIRFFRRDVTRPFIEVIAHSFDDLDQLRGAVSAEWAAFEPQFLRLRTRPGRIAGPHVHLDVTIHAAHYQAMSRHSSTVSLEPFDSVDDAIAMVQRRFDDLKISQPQLYRNVTQANADDLREGHEAGQLMAIVAARRQVGLLAVSPGSIEWIEGDVINEEIVTAAASGHGYAAAAQTAWAASQHRSPTTHLIGTIDHLNVASRKSAQRAGRPSILEEVFIQLPHEPPCLRGRQLHAKAPPLT